MRETVTISLPKKIREQLDKAVREKSASRSDVVREALQQYLLAWEFDETCRPLRAKARRLGIYSDEDVFRIVS